MKVDSILFDIAVIYRNQGAPAAEQTARDAGVLNSKNEVRLTLILTDNNTAPVEAKIKELNGRVVATYENVIDLVITLEALAAAAQNNPLAQLASFATVREIKVTPVPRTQGAVEQPFNSATYRQQMAPIVSEGVRTTGANQWQSAGITGRGVKVGIIDGAFDGYEQLRGQELPSNVTVRSFRSDGGVDGSVHGTACAEIVHAMAPDAELYLVAIEGPASLGTAFAYLQSQGVKVASISLGTNGDTRGDGSGPWAKAVDDARAKGMFVAVAAGNEGYSYYNATFNPDSEGFHQFKPNDPGLRVGVGQVLDVALRWDAWTGEPLDLDLFIFSGDGSQLLTSSRNVQSASPRRDPVELIYIPLQTSAQRQNYQIVVHAKGNSRPVKIEIFTVNSQLELATAPGSLSTPGDAKGAFTVGATNVQDGTLADYSSQGPTADRRQKPDVTAPASVLTASYSRRSPSNPAFPGTSAATPHAAGAAALVLSNQSTITPDALTEFLKSRAQDIEDPGPDNKSGAGDLRLGSPSGGAQGATSPRPSASARASAQPSASARASTQPSASPRTAAGNARLAATPASGPSGTTFTFAGTGLPASATLNAVVLDSQGRRVIGGMLPTQADGTIQIQYNSTGDPNGQYTLRLTDNTGAVLANAPYTVGSGGAATSPAPSARASTAPSAAPSSRPSPAPSAAASTAPRASAAPGSGQPVLVVSPNAGPVGTRFAFTGAGFQPNAKYGLVLAAGQQIVDADEITATSGGTLQFTFNSTGVPRGTYTIFITTPDFVTGLAKATFEVR